MNEAANGNAAVTRTSRLLIFYLSVVLWFVVVSVRLIQLQVVEGDDYLGMAERQRKGYVDLQSRRGEILDCHLEEFAISVEAGVVQAHPDKVADPAGAARQLAPILGRTERELYDKLISGKPFRYLAREISPRQMAQVKELGIAGIEVAGDSKRVYPNRELAAQVLGFVGVDGKGLSGLEFLYDDQIKGRAGRVNLRFDAKRRRFGRESDELPTRGNVMVLYLDQSIQHAVEQTLSQTVESYQAKSGSAIVMNVHSGEVLAMASYPGFNPNSYGKSELENFRNRGILDVYEPGSTFKIVTLAAVLNEGLSHPDESIDCRVGTVRLGGKVYREASRSYQALTFNQVLSKSSNVGTIKLGLRLGDERLYDYIRKFGFGAKTGIELPGEEIGLLAPPSRWSKASIGALSIGQEIGVTPLQVVRAVAVLANDGYLVKPRIVNKILSPRGDVLDESKAEREPILSPATARKMRQALALAVEAGTGKRARLSGYSSGGKTGTAQKFVDGAYSRTKYVASFAGFAPVDDPLLASIVVIDEPKGASYGGVVAAPAFKQIMERALIHLKVPRDRPDRSLKQLAQGTAPDEAPGEFPLDRYDSKEKEGLSAEELEQTVLGLMSEDPLLHSKRTVTVATDSFRMPDFRGLSLREVVRECSRLGLRLQVHGSGGAVGQRPASGSRVFKETVSEVFFGNRGSSIYASEQIALPSTSRGVASEGQ